MWWLILVCQLDTPGKKELQLKNYFLRLLCGEFLGNRHHHYYYVGNHHHLYYYYYHYCKSMWEHRALVWENRVHCWWSHPESDGPGLYKKQSGTSQQMLILWSSMVSAFVPDFRCLLAAMTWLPSTIHHNLQGEITTFAPKRIWSTRQCKKSILIFTV